MDLTRNQIIPETVLDKKILVVGVGATGSHIVIELVKLGFRDIYIYDTGEVKSHNLTNQVYGNAFIGYDKQEALSLIVEHRYGIKITPLLAVVEGDEYDIVFNCVDSKEARLMYREIAKFNDVMIETAFDVYSSDLFIVDHQKYLMSIKTSSEMISEVTSPCGGRLSVSGSIIGFVGFVIWGLINYLNGNEEHLNKRLTYMSWNPVSAIPLKDPFEGYESLDDFFS